MRKLKSLYKRVIKFKIVRIFINLSKLFFVYIIFVAIISGDFDAHLYGKSLLPIWGRTMPKGLQLEEFDLDFSINLEGEDPLGVVSPDAEFMLDKSLYIKQLIEYCIHRSFISVLVRTDKNELKIITLKSIPSKLDAIPIEERFEYKIYTPEEFYSDTSIFKNKYYYHDVFVTCAYLRSQPYMVANWHLVGRVLIVLFIGIIAWWIYKYISKRIEKIKEIDQENKENK